MTERQSLTEAPARKALGQHFLFDPDILRRTALAAGSVEGKTVIEVGPGPGGLTRAILENGAKKLICVEADDRFADALREWPAYATKRLHVHKMDARKAAWRRMIAEAGGDEPAMIIANLPYNVGTPLLVNWITATDWRGSMALMFQKEVAERICAKPGDKHYGRLAVLAASTCDAHLSFTLPPGAFNPPPKVDSAVAVLHPLPPEEVFAHIKAIQTVAGAAFGQRRKMLRASLKSLAKTIRTDATTWLETCDVNPTVRAETIDQNAFRRLATYYAEATQ